MKWKPRLKVLQKSLTSPFVEWVLSVLTLKHSIMFYQIDHTEHNVVPYQK